MQNDVRNTNKKRILFITAILIVVLGFLMSEKKLGLLTRVLRSGDKSSSVARSNKVFNKAELDSKQNLSGSTIIENIRECLGLEIQAVDLKSWIREQESKPGAQSDPSWVNLHFKVGTPEERRLRLEREDEWIRVNWFASDAEGLPILLEIASDDRPKSPEKVRASELKGFIQKIDTEWGAPEYEQKSIEVIGVDGVQLISYTEENGKIIDFQAGTTQARFMCGEDLDTGGFPCVCYKD